VGLVTVALEFSDQEPVCLANHSLSESRIPPRAATTHKSAITVKTRGRIHLGIAVWIKAELSISLWSSMNGFDYIRGSSVISKVFGWNSVICRCYIYTRKIKHNRLWTDYFNTLFGLPSYILVYLLYYGLYRLPCGT
jgi:hypothetical protein